jgi:Transcriptional regulators
MEIYEEYVKELMKCMIKNEKIINQNVTDIARGEMATLVYLIEEKDGAYASDISEQFQINTSRVAAILNSLSRKKYIQRVKDEKDQRKTHVYITESGRDYALNKKKEAHHQLMKILKELGEEDMKEYLRIMKRIVEISSHID